MTVTNILNRVSSDADPRQRVDREVAFACERTQIRARLLMLLAAQMLVCVVAYAASGPAWFAWVVAAAVLVGGMYFVAHNAIDRSWRQVADLRYQLMVAEKSHERLQGQYDEVREVDKVTTCNNRYYFQDQVRRFRALGQRGSFGFAVMLVRVDQFVDIVARDGQRGGNDTLRTFGNVLRVAMREVDVVARWEDETFAVALSDTDADGAVDAANRVMALTRQVRSRNDRRQHLTVSIGITIFEHDLLPDEMMDRAQEALCLADSQGGDCAGAYARRSAAA